MKRSLIFLGFLGSALLGGCAAHSPEPLRVRYAEIGHGGPPVRFDVPVVIEFRPGDRLPVDLHFDSEFFEASPASPPVELVAKEHCFVRVDKEGFRSSTDGVNFEAHPKVPGHFQVALSSTPAGTKLVVAVSTPRITEKP